MINYSVDSSIRRKIIVCLFILSLLLAEPANMILSWLYNLIVEWVPSIKQYLLFLSQIGISLSEVSLLSVFAVLYWLFSEFLWKIKIITKFTKIPNLNGIWKGKLVSSYIDPDTNKQIAPMDISLEIKQNWNAINIKAHFTKSNSYSKTASLHTNEQKGIVLGFSYKNDSLIVDTDSREFSGYNELTYEKDQLQGIYFSNRNNGTHGTIKLKRCKKGDDK